MSSQKRFEDWEEVDCDNCELYYINQCDGVQNDSKKPCKTFVAVRNIKIPQQIKKLRRRSMCALLLSVISLVISILSLVVSLVEVIK